MPWLTLMAIWRLCCLHNSIPGGCGDVCTLALEPDKYMWQCNSLVSSEWAVSYSHSKRQHQQLNARVLNGRKSVDKFSVLLECDAPRLTSLHAGAAWGAGWRPLLGAPLRTASANLHSVHAWPGVCVCVCLCVLCVFMLEHVIVCVHLHVYACKLCAYCECLILWGSIVCTCADWALIEHCMHVRWLTVHTVSWLFSFLMVRVCSMKNFTPGKAYNGSLSSLVCVCTRLCVLTICSLELLAWLALAFESLHHFISDAWFSYYATVCAVDSLCTNDSTILLQFVLLTHCVQMIQLSCYSLYCWLTVYKWFSYPATVCTVDLLCTNDSAILLQFVLLTHCVQMIQLSCYSLYCRLTMYKRVNALLPRWKEELITLAHKNASALLNSQAQLLLWHIVAAPFVLFWLSYMLALPCCVWAQAYSHMAPYHFCANWFLLPL